MRNKLAQKIEPLRCQLAGKNRYASDISARSVETCDEPETNRIIAAHHNDRNCTGRRLSRRDRRTIRENHRHPAIYQVAGECWQAIITIVSPAVLYCNVSTLQIPGLFRPCLKAAAIDAYPSADALLRKPITGIAGCCERAASGHATAAPPTSV